jgi:hypothetical protein
LTTSALVTPRSGSVRVAPAAPRYSHWSDAMTNDQSVYCGESLVELPAHFEGLGGLVQLVRNAV